MTPDQIKKLHDLLSTREHLEGTRASLERVRDWDVPSKIVMETFKPRQDDGPHQSYNASTIAVTLEPHERALVLDVMKVIYARRIYEVDQKLKAGGVTERSDLALNE